MYHVHIGAGNFSLGFVVWLASKAGFNSIVLTRSPKRSAVGAKTRNQILKSKLSYSIQYLDKDENGEFDGPDISIKDILYYDKDKDRKILISILSSSEEDIFITTSVKDKDAIPQISDLIQDIKKSLPPERKIFVIACENGFTTSNVEENYLKIGHDPKNIYFIDAVVDRICSGLYPQDGHLIVDVERHALLVLEKKSGCEVFFSKLNIDEVLVSQNIDVYRHVKLCVLNAAHIFLAGDAETFGMPIINHYLNVEQTGKPDAPNLSERNRHIRSILDELQEGLRHYCISNHSYNEEKLKLFDDLTTHQKLDSIMSRFRRVDDDVHRVLSRLKAPTAEELHTMSDFLRSMLDKVRAPVLGYIQKNNSGPPKITASFIRISDLVAKRGLPQKRVTHH